MNSTASRLDNLCTRGYEPRLRGASGTCRFEISGAGNWTLRVDNGCVKQIQDPGPADVLVVATSDEFDRIARGEQSIATTWLRGDVSITGDSALAAKMLSLFR